MYVIYSKPIGPTSSAGGSVMDGRKESYTEKKSGAKTAPPWSRFGKWCHFGGWSRFFPQNSAMGGAELRTMKRLQGWSRFGSTFFLSVGNIQ